MMVRVSRNRSGSFQEDFIMLVLTRKINESIIIADSIVVTILRIDGGKVRLGIEAPANVHILREELQTRVESTSQTAVPASPGQASGGR
jgi:carbon storage regulator